MIVPPLLLIAAVTAGVLWEGGGAGSSLRHLYIVPTAWAALLLGARGACLTGLLTGLVQAPLVLPAIERAGLTAQTVDGLVSLATPLAFGWLVGRVRDHSSARALRLTTLLEIQRGLAREGPLEKRLQAVAGRMRQALSAARLGLLIGTGPGATAVVTVPPGLGFDPRSAAAWTLRTGRPVATGDLPADCRFASGGEVASAPVRGLLLPLTTGEGVVGALALEWSGDVPLATRAAAAEMAVHLGVGIENARLTLRQQRFAAELEAEVAAATRRLTELDQAKSEFLSVVSHELRTPLTALQGFSELLLSRAVPPDRAARFIGHLHAEAQRLGRIVADLLDLSLIESGRGAELRRERVDLNELVERNVELFGAEHRGHRFRWEARGALPAVRGDPDAMDRILKNLLSNAVKYSPRGGEVSITARPAAAQPGTVEVIVADEGVGISGDALPRIFDRYVRIANPETATARGLGLGLTLVRRLAEAQGGRVEVESEPGRGSRFRLLLPAAPDGFLADFPPPSP